MCEAAILVMGIASFTDGLFPIAVTLYPAFICWALDLLSMLQRRWMVVIGLLMTWFRISWLMRWSFEGLPVTMMIDAEYVSLLNITYIF